MIDNVRNVARGMSDCALLHVSGALNAQIEQAMRDGINGTHAHAGMIEMAQACADELVDRRHVKGSRGPGWHDVQWEDGVRLSFSIRVF